MEQATSSSNIDIDAVDAAEKGTQLKDVVHMAGPLGVCDTATLVFSDLRYRVPNAKGGQIGILDGISGFCRGGRLLALMGASGRRAMQIIGLGFFLVSHPETSK